MRDFYRLPLLVRRTTKKVCGSNEKIISMASIDTANVSLRDVFVTRHGAKIAGIKDGEGELIYQPNVFLRVPFEPSTFDKDPNATRLNLILETTPQVQEAFQQFDEWLIQYLAEHSERILKKRLTVEQVRANYSSPIRTSDKYPATLKVKMHTAGTNEVCLWHNLCSRPKPQTEAPARWRDYRVSPRLHVCHLWIMGSTFGPVVRITDALLDEDENAPEVRKERENPFEINA